MHGADDQTYDARHDIRREADLLAAQQGWELALLRKEVNDLHQQVDLLAGDRNKALIWGIVTLGSAVVGMGLWIFNLIVGKVHP